MVATGRLLHHSREQAEINMLQAKMGGSEGEKKGQTYWFPSP